MDEATHCDQLLLLRGGELVFSDTQAALLTHTGAANADQAFLQLARAGQAADQ